MANKMDLLGEDSSTGKDESGFGISDDEMIRRMRGLVDLAIAKKELLGIPVARYDSKKNTAYLEYPDGRREYVTGV